MSRKRPEPPENCAQCEAEIPRGASSCPECGADERTGWDANPWVTEPDAVEIPEHLIDDHEDPGRAVPAEVKRRTQFVVGLVVVVAGIVWTLLQWRRG